MKDRHGAIVGLLGLLVVGFAFLSADSVAFTQEHQSQAQVMVELPAEAVEEGGPDFEVNIKADGVSNLAAYQFSIAYDSSILRYVSVADGQLLGSSGREPNCLEPKVETGSPEVLRFNCVTLGPPQSLGGIRGADGSGLLAVITFSPVNGGKTQLELREGRLVAAELDERGAPLEISTTVQSAELEVKSSGGLSWAILGPVIGVVGIVVVGGAALIATRLRGSKGRPRIQID